MTFQTIQHRVSSLILAFAILLGLVTPAFAATIGVSADANVQTSGGTDRAPKIITRSDGAIDARITALNNLSARIAGMKNVSNAVKANVAANVTTNSNGLTALKAKIDAETDVATLLTDEKSILGSFRIYALVIPQGYIIGATDRVDTIAGMMTTVSGKLQTRITAAQTAGKDVSVLVTAETDLNAKVAAAQSEASLALSGVSGLTPDQGDKSKADANHAALVAARAHIKTATEDLKAARKDIQSIADGFKAFHLNANATTSSSATVQ